MSEIKDVRSGGALLARHIPSAAATNKGLNFFSDDSDFIQVGVWGYDKGKELAPHIHNTVVRSVDRTQEILIVQNGSIAAHIYDQNEVFVEEIIVNSGDILIVLTGGHGYTILENETSVIEVKNGPYVGADADRRRF